MANQGTNAGASLVVGVKSDAALVNLRALSSELQKLKVHVKDLGTAAPSALTESMASQATAVREQSALATRAASESGRNAGRAFASSYSVALQDGTRTTVRAVGADATTVTKEMSAAGANMLSQLEKAGLATKTQADQAKVAVKQLREEMKAFAAAQQSQGAGAAKNLKDNMTQTIAAQKAAIAEMQRSGASAAKALQEQMNNYSKATQAQGSGAAKNLQAEINNRTALSQRVGAAAARELQAEMNGLAKAQELNARQMEIAFARANGYNVAADTMSKRVHGVHMEFELLGQKLKFTNPAVREMVVLLHEWSSGRVSNMPGSMLSLLSYAGMEGASILRMVGIFGAIAGSIVMITKAAVEASREVQTMNRAIESTGNMSGTSRGGMRDLAYQVEGSSRMTIKETKAMVTALVASGQISQSVLEGVMHSTEEYAKITGQSADDATQDMIKLFRDPAAAATKLNETMHLLNGTEKLRIENLMQSGRWGEAQVALLDKMKQRFAETHQEASKLQQLGDWFAKHWAYAMDNMQGASRPRTEQEQLRYLENRKRFQDFGVIDTNGPVGKELDAAIERARKAAKEADAAAVKAGKATEEKKLKETQDTLAKTTSALSQMNQVYNSIDLLQGGSSRIINEAQDLVKYRQESLDILYKQIDALKGGQAIRDKALNTELRVIEMQRLQVQLAHDMGQMTERANIIAQRDLDIAAMRARYQTRLIAPAPTIAEQADKERDLDQIRNEIALREKLAKVQLDVMAFQGRLAENDAISQLNQLSLENVNQRIQAEAQLGNVSQANLIIEQGRLAVAKLYAEQTRIENTPAFGTDAYMVQRAQALEALNLQIENSGRATADALRQYEVNQQQRILQDLAGDMDKTGDRVKAFWYNWIRVHGDELRQLSTSPLPIDNAAADTMRQRAAAQARDLELRESRDRQQAIINEAQAEIVEAQAYAEAGKTKAFTDADRNAILQKYLTLLQQEKDRLGDVTSASAEVQKQFSTLEKNVANLQAKMSSNSWAEAAQAAMNKYVSSVGSSSMQMERAFTRSFSSMEDAIVEFAKTGKFNFRDFASVVIEEIIRMSVRAQMSKIFSGMSLMNFFGGGSGAGGGAFISDAIGTPTVLAARGHAFAGHGVHAFARGGAFGNGEILTQPTMFRFAAGGAFRTGVAGEAGPEAAVPLKRMSNGVLGINAEGMGGANVTNIYQIEVSVQGGDNPQQTGDIISNKLLRTMENIADKRILESKRPNGMLNRTGA
jgi:lambda family phage tail tape measure protein